MGPLRAIYLVGSRAEGGGWFSLERRLDDPRRLAAHATAEAAVRAEALGEVLLPGPFISEGSVSRLSDLPAGKLAKRLRELLGELASVYDLDDQEVSMFWSSYSKHDFLGELPPEKLEAFLALFPHRDDSRLTGPRVVLRVEVED